MKFLIVAALVIISFASLTSADKACKDLVKTILHKQLKSYSDCKKSLSFTSEEDKLSKINCILKCAMTKEQVLTADGYVDEASALAFVEREIPKDLQPKALELMTKCMSFTDSVNPEEPSCQSYNPLIKCAMGVLFKVCDA